MELVKHKMELGRFGKVKQTLAVMPYPLETIVARERCCFFEAYP